MASPRFSANLGFLWPDRPLLERVEAAARAGFPAIELHWPYETPAAQLRKACNDGGLALLALNTPKGGRPEDFGLAAVPGREREFRDGFRRASDYVGEAGGSAIHVMAGVAAPGSGAAEVLRANLLWALEEDGQSVLLLEGINRRDRPGYFYSTVNAVRQVVDDIASDRLRLMFDAYHVGVEEGDILAGYERVKDIVHHVQVAAVPTRAEPDEGFEPAQLFHTLELSGYEGWIGCEYLPRADTDAGLAWMEAYGNP